MSTVLWSDVVGKFYVCKQAQLGEVLSLLTLELGADIRPVNLKKAHNSDEVMAFMAKRLNFPEYFGVNLDALYDVTDEYAHSMQAQIDAEKAVAPQVWLLHTQSSQEKLLFPIMDTLRDVMSAYSGLGLSIVWVKTADA